MGVDAAGEGAGGRPTGVGDGADEGGGGVGGDEVPMGGRGWCIYKLGREQRIRSKGRKEKK